MTEEQIKEVMRLGELWATYAWKACSHGADETVKSQAGRAALEAYLRTIGEPAGYSLPAGSMGEKKWAQLPKDCKPIGLVFQRIDAKTGAITEAGRVTWADWLAYPEADEPESVNAELLEALRTFESSPKPGAFRLGDLVKKVSGSAWEGRIVGTYSTALTPEGYAVESASHPGSVQIYPAKALTLVIQEAGD